LGGSFISKLEDIVHQKMARKVSSLRRKPQTVFGSESPADAGPSLTKRTKELRWTGPQQEKEILFYGRKVRRVY
jgi:hypothetical protein